MLCCSHLPFPENVSVCIYFTKAYNDWLKGSSACYSHQVQLDYNVKLLYCSTNFLNEHAVFLLRWTEAYLNLNGPCKVADVYKERYVWAVAKIKVLVRKAVFELLDVAPRDDGDLLPGLGACWRTEKQREKRHRGAGGKRESSIWRRMLTKRWKMKINGRKKNKTWTTVFTSLSLHYTNSENMNLNKNNQLLIEDFFIHTRWTNQTWQQRLRHCSQTIQLREEK